jgi:hypothetical protein
MTSHFQNAYSGSGDELPDTSSNLLSIGQKIPSLNISLLSGVVENPVPLQPKNSSDCGFSLNASSSLPTINSNPIATSSVADVSSRISVSM